jgi:hypothetical protein
MKGMKGRIRRGGGEWQNMNRYHLRRSALFTGILLLLLAGSASLWLRVQRRQYALNRQLIAALVKGDDKQSLALVKGGADPNTRYTPLPVPSLPRMVKQLLHRSAPPANDSPTALGIACGTNWDFDWRKMDAQEKAPDLFSLVHAMFRHGGNVNAQSQYRETPLWWAVRNNRSSTARELLQDGANVNAKNSEGNSPLIAAIVYKRSPQIVRLLLDYRADPNATDHIGLTVLENAVILHWDIETLRQLLAHGANPNLPDKNGDTALKFAQYKDDPDIIALLKHYGARK